MSLIITHPYTQRDFSQLRGLKGISDAQLAVHFALYAGYVANTNKCNELIAEMSAHGQAGTHPWAEANRRLGWEYNGMRLHEYYFGNLHPGGRENPGGKFLAAVRTSFGTLDAWRDDFVAVASMRGIGWVILYRDPLTEIVSNHWITEHDQGHPAGFTPLVVLDVFEHAFMVDYKPAERRKYIDAVFDNLDWTEIERRLN
jgi:Fe-Mn family superoxide dismutase